MMHCAEKGRDSLQLLNLLANVGWGGRCFQTVLHFAHVILTYLNSYLVIAVDLKMNNFPHDTS